MAVGQLRGERGHPVEVDLQEFPTKPAAPAHDGLRSRAVTSVRWTIVEKWGGRLMTMAIFSLLARYVAPAEFGLISMAMVLMAFMVVFVDSGFARTLVQQRQLSPADIATAFWTSVALAGVAYAVVFFAAPLLEDVYDAPGLVLVVRILGLTLIISALSGVPAALLERDFQFRSLSIRVLAGTIAGGAVGVGSALAGAGVWALVAQMLTTQVVSLVTLWWAAHWLPSFTYSLDSLRRLGRFGVSVLGISVLNVLQAQIDKFLIGILLGPEVLGYYFVAQRLLMLMSDLMTTVISRLSLTTFAKVQDDLPRLNRGFLQLTFLSGMIGVPAFGLVALFAAEIIPVVLGPEWSDAIPLVQLFCASYALLAIIYFDKDVLLAIGRPGIALRLGLVENVVGVLVLVATAPLGVMAIAIGRSVQRFVVWPYRCSVLHRYARIQIGPYTRNLLTLFVALFPAWAVAALLDFTPWSNVDHALVLYAMPASLLILAVYYATAMALAGRKNRSTIFGTLNIFLGRGQRQESRNPR